MTRRILLAALAASLSLPAQDTAVRLSAQDLAVRLDGDYLRISLPRVDFLQGKTLDRLKDGASVAFIGQLTISTSQLGTAAARTPAARSIARFALSYDIWEERFSVTRIGQTPAQRRTVSHLSAAAAEAWCMDSLTIDRGLVPADKDFYVQLDLRAEDPKEQLGSVFGDPGINITRLIEIFGRPARGSQPRWLLSSGPHRLVDLKKLEVRGVRG